MIFKKEAIIFVVLSIIVFASSCAYQRQSIVDSDGHQDAIIQQQIAPQYQPLPVAKNLSQPEPLPQKSKETSVPVEPASVEKAQILYPAEDPKIDDSKNQQLISEFIEWGKKHGIQLIGVNKTVNDFYYKGAKKEDFLDVRGVPDLLEIAEGLYKIPEHLLKVMDGKAFYISYQQGRGYAVLGSWPEQNILSGVNRGVILEQPLVKEDAVHEFAHILDYHGIRGMYEDNRDNFRNLEQLRKEIFDVPFEYNPNLQQPPEGYIDVYSTANDAENFAQHFAAYIFQGETFRALAKDDALLKKKYDFFKNKLFEGKEY